MYIFAPDKEVNSPHGGLLAEFADSYNLVQNKQAY